MSEKIEKASDLLSIFLSGKQFEEGEKWASFFVFWKKMLGERLAAHSHIRDIRNGALIIEADHPGWIQMLQLKQSDILEEIKKKFPEIPISSVHIRLSERKFWTEEHSNAADREAGKKIAADNDSNSSAEGERPSEPVPGIGEPSSRGDDPIDRIKDGPFRELLVRLETSIRKRQSEKPDRREP